MDTPSLSFLTKELVDLMSKPDNQKTTADFKKIKALAEEIATEEKKLHQISLPETLGGMIEVRLIQLKMKPKDLAKRLRISEQELSQILQGKQKPNAVFLKGVKNILKIDVDFLWNPS